MANLKTATAAYLGTHRNQFGYVFGKNDKFICAHCGAYAEHHWGTAVSLVVYSHNGTSNRSFSGGAPTMANCQVCEEETIFINNMMIYPKVVEAPLPNADMPEDVATDFNEARQVAALSPRGSAALLRLAIQKLCPVLGATKKGIDEAIGELVEKGIINVQLQQALDVVRVIGNEAVHPGTIDLKDDHDTAMLLFELVNFIVDRGISEPKKIQTFYAGLPAGKLAGIANRDRKAGGEAKSES